MLTPFLCSCAIYIYCIYAPRLMLLLERCLKWIFFRIFRCRAQMSQLPPATRPPDYDLWVLSSDDSKYWVSEHVISWARDLNLQVFWQELLTPGVFSLSSSLDALHRAKKTIVIISPEDGYFCHQFECMSRRVVEDRLSPLDVMLVRLCSVAVDKFRRHNQFDFFFDWDNTVFRRDVFERKISQWLNVQGPFQI